MDFEALNALKETISNQTDVALEITKQLLQTELKDKNMVYSPLSIHIVLSMIAADETGPSLDQFLSVLKSKSTDDLNSLAFNLVTAVLADGSASCGPCLNFANGLWVREPHSLESSYQQVLCNSYKASIKQVTMGTSSEEVRTEVNAWVKEQTRGLIPEILPPGSANGIRISANALYFKATWYEEYFHESETKEDVFHLLGGDIVDKVPFMTSSAEHCITAFEGFKALRLPYQASEDYKDCRSFSMWLLLPDAIDGLPALTHKVCSEPGFIDVHLRSWESVEVGKFLIPKFKISTRFEASDILGKLGLTARSSEMYHQAIIEVNEKDTTAAAATVDDMCFALCEDYRIKKKEDFVADHPFMFLIKEDRTGAVLFMGHVLNPLGD
ncbi:serpin-ZX-like [Rosa sericea]